MSLRRLRLWSWPSWNYKEERVVTHHEQYSVSETTGGLSVLFTVLCIVDLFGVFPVVTLPKAIISCDYELRTNLGVIVYLVTWRSLWFWTQQKSLIFVGIYGVPMVIFVFGLQVYTATLLGRCWVIAKSLSPQIGNKNRYPYAALAELTFGRRVRGLVTFLLDATVFGAGVPNLLVASQTFQLFWWKISGGEVGVSFCIWLLLIGLLLCPVMWLGSPKDMKPLALSSVCIVSTVALSTWICILLDDKSPLPTTNFLDHVPRFQDFLVAYGIIAFQFDIHPMLLTIQVDMKDSSKINIAVIGGFLITAIMFAVTTTLAAYRYGQSIQSNILEGIPASVPLFIVALLVALQLCLSSAVGNSALFQHVEDILKIPRNFSGKRCIVRSSIVALAVFLGETVPRFDLVMGLVGSTLTGPLMFIFPPLFFLKLTYMKDRKNHIQADISIPHTLNGVSHEALANINGGIPRFNAVKKLNGSMLYSNGTEEKDGLIFPPIIPENNLYTRYKTFSMDHVEVDTARKVQILDLTLAVFVMIFGVSATVIATYTSWSDTINYATFTTPCLVNATAAARDFVIQ